MLKEVLRKLLLSMEALYVGMLLRGIMTLGRFLELALEEEEEGEEDTVMGVDCWWRLRFWTTDTTCVTAVLRMGSAPEPLTICMADGNVTLLVEPLWTIVGTCVTVTEGGSFFSVGLPVVTDNPASSLESSEAECETTILLCSDFPFSIFIMGVLVMEISDSDLERTLSPGPRRRLCSTVTLRSRFFSCSVVVTVLGCTRALCRARPSNLAAVTPQSTQ